MFKSISLLQAGHLRLAHKLKSFQNYFNRSGNSGYEADQRLLQWGSKLGRNVAQLEREAHTRDDVMRHVQQA